MRIPPMPLDPLSLTRLGIAAWLTDLMVARKFSEALWRQSALMIGAMRLVAYDGRAG